MRRLAAGRVTWGFSCSATCYAGSTSRFQPIPDIREPLEQNMTKLETEVLWLRRLPLDGKIRFLAELSFQMTVAGRASYEAGTEDLIKPRLLRQINETQHRVTSGLIHLLTGSCWNGFEGAVATWLFTEPDAELNELLQYCWERAKMNLWCKQDYDRAAIVDHNRE